MDVDDALADGPGDVQAEEEEGDEVEEGRLEDRVPRRKNARGDDCGDGIGGIVEAVDEIEHEGEDDQKDDIYFHSWIMPLSAVLTRPAWDADNIRIPH